MTVYTLLIEDRHVDVTVEVYEDREAAVQAAKAVVKKYGRFPEDVEEQEVAGWEYYCTYSCEGDSVRVERKEVIAEDAP